MVLNNHDLSYIFYFMGLIQSDGGMYCFCLAPYAQLKPIFKLASKTNTNTLLDAQKFLSKIEVYASYEQGQDSNRNTRNPGRAPSLRVQGKGDINKIITIFEQTWSQATRSKAPLLGAKRRDLQLLKLICSPTQSFSAAQKVDINLSFHKYSYSDQDLRVNVNEKSRKEKEIENNVVGLSQGSAQHILEELDSHCEKADPLLIPCTFWLGLLDGDGGFHVSCRARGEGKARYLEFSTYITLTLELGSEEVFRGFEKALNLKPLKIIDFRQTTGKNGLQTQIRDGQEVKKVINYIKNCGFPRELRGDTKTKDFELMENVQNLRESGALKKTFSGNRAEQHELMRNILLQIFPLGDRTRKGPKRSLDFEKAMNIVLDLYT